MDMSDQWEYDGVVASGSPWRRSFGGERNIVNHLWSTRGTSWILCMVKIFKRPYDIFLTGLVCADPNVVLLEAELRGGQIEGRARWSGLGGHVPHYSCFSHV